MSLNRLQIIHQIFLRRRSNLCDPLEILCGSYENTFTKNINNGIRIDIKKLQVSDKGKRFIKKWGGDLSQSLIMIHRAIVPSVMVA